MYTIYYIIYRNRRRRRRRVATTPLSLYIRFLLCVDRFYEISSFSPPLLLHRSFSSLQKQNVLSLSLSVSLSISVFEFLSLVKNQTEMEKNSPVRKSHTSTADLLTWPENQPFESPAAVASRSGARSHQVLIDLTIYEFDFFSF